jgi:hypothetical protein
VSFEAGEPIRLLVPQRRGELESFRPQLRRLEADPQVRDGYQAWSRDRAQFLTELKTPGSAAAKQAWQRHYFQGVSTTGEETREHQTKLRLQDFAPLPPSHPGVDAVLAPPADVEPDGRG